MVDLSNISHLPVCSLSLQLFTEYGRLAMEETFLKPFQVHFLGLRELFLFMISIQEVELQCSFFFHSP